MEFLCSKMENVCYNGIKKILGGILVENRRKSDIAIGKNMADMRSKFSLTQKDVAQVVGVNVSTYKHYELGDRCVPPSVLKALANFYKIHVDYFFENVPESDDIREHLFFTNYTILYGIINQIFIDFLIYKRYNIFGRY